MTEQVSVALCPESFGYGPASKAHSVALAIGPSKCLGICDGIAQEYLQRNGIETLPLTAGEMLASTQDGLLSIRAAAAFLNPQFASAISTSVPTAFIDSLTFMWDVAILQRLPGLTSCLHIVQDVLGAREAARNIGLENVVFVEPIIDLSSVPVSPWQIVASLGGQVIHGSTKSVVHYYRVVTRLLKRAIPVTNLILLMSSIAKSAVQNELIIRSKSANHSEAIGYFTSADVVLTPPGLTTLLELTALRKPCIPLPPQNYSQCIIVTEASTRCGAAQHPAWRILGDFFSPPRGLTEKVGVAWAQDRLNTFLRSSAYINYEQSLSATYLAQAPTITDGGFTGASQVATLIEGLALQQEPPGITHS